jgi:SAM-dependent methyltransferase
VTEGLRSSVVCPRCRAALDVRASTIECAACGQAYPRLASIAVLVPRPDAHIEHWRRQLGLIVAQANETRKLLAAQAEERGIRQGAQARLRSLARGVGEQGDDIAAVLGPVLGGPLPPSPDGGLPRGVVDYIPYLYRDWAWSEGNHEENRWALDAIRSVTGERALGRTLVVGAGACRLAYDLHRSLGVSETSAVDIDPYLLVFAEAVVRGGTVKLVESTANVQEIERIGRSWTLAAPFGPLADDVFHFFLANGLEPPFADSAFDTIVAPWFIDQVPTDLPAFLRKLHGLLAPGGRWIHHGPLIYRPEATPIALRFSREEVFDLAADAGFRVGRWEAASRPYLVSPLTGRGKVEWVVTFEALRL